MVSGEHNQLEKMSSTTPMLPANGKSHSNHVIIAPSSNGVGKILIREDTILGSIPGCAGCGRTKFQCGEGKQWSALCWGKRSERKYAYMMLTLMATFLISLVGTIFFCFTNVLNNAIISNMVLSNNSIAFKMWQNPTIEPLMKVHIFNYTNVERVKAGLDQKLKVEDLGPFVYSQSVKRINTHFNGDGTLTYQERAAFTFLPELSGGYTQFDRVVVPNLPLIGAIHKSVPFGSFAQFSLNTGLSLLPNHGAFIELAAHRFLWGYDDDIIKIAAPILKLKGEMPFERFGLLVTKNGTLPDKITINTGENDINRLNYIERINGQSSLNHWGTPTCNSMDATDGSIFPASMLDRNTTLYVYKENLCRRMPFVYQKDVELQELDGILALRYAPPMDVFDDPAHNPDNQCYCHIDSGRCPPRGVVNVSACAFGTPAMASFPHFYLGDPRLVDALEGLHPDPDIHSSYIDLHPKLGIPLNLRSGIQINVQVPKTDFFFSELQFIEQGLILPIAWIETTMGTIPEGIRTLVYHGTYSTAAAQMALSWGCGLLLLISGASLILLFRRRKPKPCATIKKFPETKPSCPALDSL